MKWKQIKLKKESDKLTVMFQSKKLPGQDSWLHEMDHQKETPAFQYQEHW